LTIEPDGSCIISGRSDATINRHGLRMGTADIYAAVEDLAAVADCMVVDLDDGNGDSQLVMFVVPSQGHALDAELTRAISSAIRTTLSPRFIPDHVVEAPAIPRTLSGKKQELPIKRLFLGWPVDKVIDPNLTQNADVLDWYVAQAANWSRNSNRPEQMPSSAVRR
jgi:acetoacetyl-CoA synthetase